MKQVLKGSLLPQVLDIWPASFWPQRQVAGEVQTQPQDRAVNQIAMMLAILGLGLSYYSAKQMTEKVQVQPAPWRKPDPGDGIKCGQVKVWSLSSVRT